MDRTARQLMDQDGLTVEPDLPLTTLGRLLVEKHQDGACVVHDGKLLGVVTAMDLIFQDKRPHLPAFITFMEAVIPLERPSRTEAELRKMAASTVVGVMTADVATVAPATPGEDVAELMVRRRISVVPVMDNGVFIGAVTRASMLRAHVEA
ncbi:MAG: CBS domain-containing protein [Deltaproteobacteria bacterium]|nr:CBS domain-containing protein [Deltaproteobacteria bacterium]